MEPEQKGEVSLRLLVTLVKRGEIMKGLPFEPRSFDLDRSRLSVGRRPYNDIVLDHVTVSGEHAVLERRGELYELIDTGSSNGSFVNGKRVMRKLIRAGDYVGIGVYQLQLVSNEAPVPVRPAQAVSSALASLRQGRIEYLSGPLKGLAQPVDRAILKIGRGSGVAVIGRRRDGFYLTHLEGLHPTLLNGEAVTVGSRTLHHGDLIQLGDVQLRFSMAQATTASR